MNLSKLSAMALVLASASARAQFYPISAGAVPYGNTARALTSSPADFKFDGTTKQLLVGITASAAAPSYSFVGAGNTDNGMWRSGTDQISFGTAGQERLRINASGHSTFMNGITATTLHITEGITGTIFGSITGFVRQSGDTMAGALVSSSGSAGTPAIGVGSGDTGLYRSSAGRIAFSTAGAYRADLRAFGNGTLFNFNGGSDGTLLASGDPVSFFRLSGGASLTDGSQLLLYGSTHATRAGDFSIHTGGSERLKISSAGDIAQVSGTAPWLRTAGDTMTGDLVANANIVVSPPNSYKIDGGTVLSVGTGVGANNVLVGGGGSGITSGTSNIIVGRGSGNTLTTASENTIIGSASATQLNGGENVVVGSAAGTQLTSGSRNVIIGDEAGSITGPNTGQNNILIGRGARHGAAGISGSIGIGSIATPTASNQAVIGSASTSIADVFFGNGVTQTSPQSYAINGTGGSGTDVAGGNVTIAGGKGTGSGVGGSIILSVASAGSTGSSLNNIVERARVTSSGVQVSGSLALNGSTSGSVTLTAPAAAGSQSYTLPSAVASSVNMFLGGTTTGVLSWAKRIEHVTIDATCTSSPCTMVNASSGVSSVTRGGTGNYTVNFSPAWTSSSTYTCSFAMDEASGTASGEHRFNSRNSSSFNIRTCNSACDTATDKGFHLVCVGT